MWSRHESDTDKDEAQSGKESPGEGWKRKSPREDCKGAQLYVHMHAIYVAV